MAYYDICPYCGSTLDPGEKCDCQEEAEKECNCLEEAREQEEFLVQHIKSEPVTGQMVFCWGGRENESNE